MLRGIVTRVRLHATAQRAPAFLGRGGLPRPVSTFWGNDRGTPIDRYYIDAFISAHRGDLNGDILEVKDTRYSAVFATDARTVAVLDIDAANEAATVVGDLTRPETLPARAYDCFVITQTLQYIFDVRAAAASVAHVLRPTGVALVTLPSVSRITASVGVDREFWRFTTASARALFEPHFDSVDVHAYGNVLTCAGFLYGLAAEELSASELEAHDEFFPTLIAVRASGPR